jgi:hypothetical protein
MDQSYAFGISMAVQSQLTVHRSQFFPMTKLRIEGNALLFTTYVTKA